MKQQDYLNKYNLKNKKQKELFLKKFFALPEKRKKIFRDYIVKRAQKHKFHIVAPSPWPISTALSAFILVIGLVAWMHKMPFAKLTLFFGFVAVLFSMFLWFRDIIREGTYCGYHTQKVQLNLRYGFTLFIISEIMFFFGFFWALLHFILCPSIFGGNIWPPEGIVNFFIAENLNELIFFDFNSFYFLNNYSEFFSIWFYKNYNFSTAATIYYSDINNFFNEINFKDDNNIVKKNYISFFRGKFGIELEKTLFYTLEKLHNFFDTTFHINLYSSGLLVNPLSIPLVNTIILLSSGVFLTYSHICLKIQKFLRSIIALTLTIIFGIYFFSCQLYEYNHARFSINDGIYGSTFYMLTGFHGFHVFIGTVFLIVCLIRFFFQHFTPIYHFGFEAAIWYWHFVDVVWILLFFLVYYWPSIFFFKDSHYIITNELICINQNIIDLNKFYFLNNLLNKEFSLNFNKKLIELVLLNNETNLINEIEKIKLENNNYFEKNKILKEDLFNIIHNNIK